VLQVSESGLTPEELEYRKNFGKRLHFLRRIRKLTQEQLAASSGRTANMISLLENGDTSPSFETLQRLAKALGVEPADLLIFDRSIPKRWQE
jgi:transcriptional regulator with XRE-family HTH domain